MSKKADADMADTIYRLSELVRHLRNQLLSHYFHGLHPSPAEVQRTAGEWEIETERMIAGEEGET